MIKNAFLDKPLGWDWIEGDGDKWFGTDPPGFHNVWEYDEKEDGNWFGRHPPPWEMVWFDDKCCFFINLGLMMLKMFSSN